MKGPGISPVKIPILDKLARKYVAHRDERLEALRHEVETKEKLVQAMHLHTAQIKTPSGTLVYHYDEMVITLFPGKEKLKVEAEPITKEKKDA